MDFEMDDDMDMAPFADEAEESDGKENAGGDDEAVEAPDGKSKKRASAKPKSNRPGTLDEMANKLFGDRGLKCLLNEFKAVKFKGEGHEFRDLDVMVAKYEYWAHRLYPRLKFSDAIEKLERIGEKRDVKVRCSNLQVNEEGVAVEEPGEGGVGAGGGLDFELGPGCTLAMDNDDEDEDDDMNGIDINDLLAQY